MGKNKSSRVHPPYKTKHRVGNWREYEAGLRARGDITVWFTPEAIWNPVVRPGPHDRTFTLR